MDADPLLHVLALALFVGGQLALVWLGASLSH
jgi:hypothetical protein